MIISVSHCLLRPLISRCFDNSNGHTGPFSVVFFSPLVFRFFVITVPACTKVLLFVDLQMNQRSVKLMLIGNIFNAGQKHQ